MKHYYIYNIPRNKFWKQNRHGYTLDFQSAGYWPQNQLSELNLDKDDELVLTTDMDKKYLAVLKKEVARLS